MTEAERKAIAGLRTRSATTRQDIVRACYCAGAICSDPTEWRVASPHLLETLFASDRCLAHALRSAGLPALVELAHRDRETQP